MKRLAVLALLAGLAAGAAVEGAATQTVLPSSLEGETFAAESGDITNGQANVTAPCNSGQAETDTWSFTASGVAVGPYSGTFTESGTVTTTFTPAPPDPGSLDTESVSFSTTWQVRFTVDSPAGRVTGTKTATQTGEAFCQTITGGGLLLQRHLASSPLSYQANITTADGTFKDSGQASASIEDSTCSDSSGLVRCFHQNFNEVDEQFTFSSGVLPLDTSGKATGGGEVVTGSNPLGGATFGFTVRKSEDGKLAGECNLVDHATATHVRCLDATDYQQIGNTATWSGHAEVNGAVEDYRITAQDNGEPNQGLDTFVFHSPSYDVGGDVEDGNVVIHRQTTP